MKTLIYSFLGIFACLLLTNCSKPQDTSATKSGKQCVQRCLERKTTCNKRCESDREQCLNRAKKVARDRYAACKKEGGPKQGNAIAVEKDFYDPAPCNKSCHCIKSKESCYALCGVHSSVDVYAKKYK
jgi:hypothetical protein